MIQNLPRKRLLMARSQLRKRPYSNELQDHRPSKKIKSTGELYRSFPPEFWDSLSAVPLTRRALREHDRRNSTRITPEPTTPTVYTSNLTEFTRHGGPDLRDIRGV